MKGRKMKIGNHDFDLNSSRPYVMGILNVTPDSFSDGGSYNGISDVLKKVAEMISDGADMIDIGGESTRPGYTVISDEEEIERTAPVVEAVKSNFDIAVTLDTYKSAVAEAGLKAGADMINDIMGLKYERNPGKVCRDAGAGIILMHNRDNTEYKDLISDVTKDLMESVSIAVNYGIPEDMMILDPGIGFGKTREQNLQVIRGLDTIVKDTGFPMLFGVSRKSVIGLTLDLPVNEREEGTIAANVMAYNSGCRIFRVHNVKMNRRALDMAEAIAFS